MKPRDYQTRAVDSLFRFFETSRDGNPILALPTGAGKSVIQALFIKRVLEQWPNERFLLLAHVKELLQQNADKIRNLCPDVSVGLYSAGLGSKDASAQVVVAGIQSVYKKAADLGAISLVIVDECHMVSNRPGSMYQKLFERLRSINPHLRIVGMSATPFRTDSGSLIDGEDRTFDKVVARVPVDELIEKGYLCKVVSAEGESRAKVHGIKTRAGDFAVGELEKFMMNEALTRNALDEAVRLCADRKSWLVFCVGVEHAQDVCMGLKMRGVSSEIVVGDTPQDVRAQRLEAFKRGEIRALVSVGVLTTGFDAPNADALICLRPTQSKVLWVQMCGRVMRICEGKESALVADFTENTHFHGPINHSYVDARGRPRSKAVLPGEKACPGCLKPIAAAAMSHSACGWRKEVKKSARELLHDTQAQGGKVISMGQDFRNVESWGFFRHQKRDPATGLMKTPTLRVEYYCGLQEFKEWVCLEHEGFAKKKADRWWRKLSGKPAPKTIEEALGRLSELKKPDRIAVKRDGKWWRVEDHRQGAP